MPVLWYENACYTGTVFDNQSTTTYHHSVNKNLSFRSYPAKTRFASQTIIIVTAQLAILMPL